MVEQTYEVRNKSWEVYAATILPDTGHFSAAVRMHMRDAFNAGWAARKAAQYQIGTVRENLLAHETASALEDLRIQNKS